MRVVVNNQRLMAWRRAPLFRSVQLCGWRLAESGAWRFACVGCIALSAWFALSVVYLGLKGQGLQVAGVLSRAAVVIGWYAGLIVSWWSATDRAGADQSDGVIGLARCHGLSADSMPLARALAAWARLTALVWVSTLPILIATVATAPTLALAGWRLTALVPLTLYAGGVGLVGGALASACDVASPRHGRPLLAALVLVPWSLDGVLLAGRAQAGSLPGILGFLATLAGRMGAG